MNRANLQAEQILLSKPIVVKVFANVGTQSGNSLTGNTSNSNLSELAVTLLPKEERSISTEKFGIQIREELSAIPGLKVTIKPTKIAVPARHRCR